MGMASKEYHEGYQQGYKDAKADYEARLKADMVAMLTELDNKIMEEYIEHMEVDWHTIIQQKIDKLKGEEKC